jgi:hypothetical protein
MLFYRAALPLSRQTLSYVAGVIRRHRAAKKAGHAFVMIDGTLIAIDRVAQYRPSCSGRHGMNLQVIFTPDGEILWVSGPQKAANRAHARLRAPGEWANAQPKAWHILRKLRCCPWQAGRIAKAIHVLQTQEIGG